MSAQNELNTDLSLDADLEHTLPEDTYEKSQKRKRYSARIVHQTGIPEDILGKERLTTHLYLAHIRTLLTRCSVAQAAIYELDCKPWERATEQDPRLYYEKMKKYALKAQSLAEKLSRWELQARCDYWVGRAYGGTRDWQNAAKFFARAIECDVSHNQFADKQMGWKGLRPSEKNDVHFLKEDTTRRWEEREARTTAAAKAIAEVESENTGRNFEDVLRDGDYSPTWLPERCRFVFDANKEIALRRRLGRKSNSLDAEELSQIERQVERNIRQEWKEKGTAYMTRRVLSKEQRCYVFHGDEWKADRQYTGERMCTRCAQYWAKCRNTTNTSLRSSASKMSSSKPSPPNSVNLEYELPHTSWDSSGPAPPRMQQTFSIRFSSRGRPSPSIPSAPSVSQRAPITSAISARRHDLQSRPRPFSMPRGFTNPTTLNERRNLKISPIRTSNIQWQRGVTQAPHYSAVAGTRPACNGADETLESLSKSAPAVLSPSRVTQDFPGLALRSGGSSGTADSSPAYPYMFWARRSREASLPNSPRILGEY